VSFATDTATEIVYPLLPFFLTRVLNASVISLGVVEGAAEAANSLLKIWAGRASDRAATKRPLVLLGYSISSFARPFIALAGNWTQVFSVRILDRVGKGIRTAPRDAMLAGWTTPSTRGRVYGFHRGMDHAGAVVGPLLASLFLLAYPDRYRLLFGLTIVPGLIAVLLILLVPEPEAQPRTEPKPEPGAISRNHSQVRALDGDASGPLPPTFSRFMFVLTLFTLGNSTDAFLLLRLTDAAGSVQFVPAMWAALHVVKTATSMIGGAWSDRVGRRTVIAAGWLVYAAVYAGFATSESLPALLGWFLMYGLYFGLSEGTEKALVADLAPAERRGLAFGLYNAVTGLGALAASVIFGVVWTAFGTAAAFGLGAALALLATALLFVVLPSPRASVTGQRDHGTI
jgi:MFS family permease